MPLELLIALSKSSALGEEFSFRPRAIVGFSNCKVMDLQDSAM